MITLVGTADGFCDVLAGDLAAAGVPARAVTAAADPTAPFDPAPWLPLSETPSRATFFLAPWAVPAPVLDALPGLKIGLSAVRLPRLGRTVSYDRESLDAVKALAAAPLSSFDAVFHHDAGSERFLLDQGIRLSGFLPFPVPAGTWRPLGRDPLSDVVAIGPVSAAGARALEALAHDHVVRVVDPLPVDDHLRDALAAARVILHAPASRTGGWDAFLQYVLCLGVPVVAPPLPPNGLVQDGVHVLTAPADGLEAACRAVLADPLSAEVTARKAAMTIRRSLAARDLLPMVIDQVASGAISRAVADPAIMRLEPLEACLRFNGFDHLLKEVAVDA